MNQKDIEKAFGMWWQDNKPPTKLSAIEEMAFMTACKHAFVAGASVMGKAVIDRFAGSMDAKEAEAKQD